MNDTFKRYVTDIVNQIDGSVETKEDLFEELMSHLEESYQSFIKDGYDKDEAEKKVLRAFGDTMEIGHELQQAMYPYQQKLLFTLSITSIIYSFLIYLIQLFNEGDAYILWLIMSVGINVLLLLFVFNVIRANGKRQVNTVLVIHIVIYFFGLGLALGLNHFLVSMLSIYSLLIMVLAITLIYLNVIFHWEMSKLKKGFHIFNISTGLFIIVANLFAVWVFLVFSEGFTPRFLLLFIPFILWVISYIVQMAFIHKGLVKAGIAVACVPALLVGGIVLLEMFIFLP